MTRSASWSLAWGHNWGLFDRFDTLGCPKDVGLISLHAPKTPRLSRTRFTEKPKGSPSARLCEFPGGDRSYKIDHTPATTSIMVRIRKPDKIFARNPMDLLPI